MEWKLDLSLPIPKAEQIKGQIIYAISFGSLQPGDSLPSVRELAHSLKVAPGTITKVYRDLTHEGLLLTKPNVGVFVNEMGFNGGKKQQAVSPGNLNHIIENSIRQAKLMGYSFEEIRRAFTVFEEQHNCSVKNKTILIVGNYLKATSFYAQQIEEILQDINVRVIPVTIHDLQSGSESIQHLIKRADLIVTIPQRVHEVREIMGQKSSQVVAIAFETSPTTVQNLRNIREAQRVGIVSTYPEFVQILVNELASYGLNIHPPLIALISQEDRIHDMLQQVDVLVYATGSEDILNWELENIQTIEFLHRPKAESVNRLRSLIAS